MGGIILANGRKYQIYERANKLSRFKAKKQGHTDANHGEVKNALEQAGYTVIDISASANASDLLVSGGRLATCLIEVKTQEKDARFSLSQIEMMGKWRGYIAFASGGLEAVKIMRSLALYALTERQQNALLQFAHRRKAQLKPENKNRNPMVSVSVIEKLLKL